MAYIGKVTAAGNAGMPVAQTLYGTCSTAASTAAKVVSCPSFDTTTGVSGGTTPDGTTIAVFMSSSNTASSPTLDVNSSGAAPIRSRGTSGAGNTSETSWYANSVVLFTYSTTSVSTGAWYIVGKFGYDAGDTHTGAYLVDSRTSAAAAITTSTVSGFASAAGSLVFVSMKYDVPANATLSASGTAALGITTSPTQSIGLSGGEISAGDVAVFGSMNIGQVRRWVWLGNVNAAAGGSSGEPFFNEGYPIGDGANASIERRMFLANAWEQTEGAIVAYIQPEDGWDGHFAGFDGFSDTDFDLGVGSRVYVTFPESVTLAALASLVGDSTLKLFTYDSGWNPVAVTAALPIVDAGYHPIFSQSSYLNEFRLLDVPCTLELRLVSAYPDNDPSNDPEEMFQVVGDIPAVPISYDNRSYYGTCSTAASTTAKTVIGADFPSNPIAGATVNVLFTAANTASAPQLKVGADVARDIYVGGSVANGTTNVLKWSANTLVTFVFDGTRFRFVSSSEAGSVEPSRGASTWYGTCSTAASTAAKTCTVNNFVLQKGATVRLLCTTDQTYASGAITLNVNSTGAKTVYARNNATSSSNPLRWASQDIVTFVYDGTYWRFAGKVGSHVVGTFTFAASGWSAGGVHSALESSWPFALYDVEVFPCESTTPAMLEAWGKANVVGSVTSTNSVKRLSEENPSIDITMGIRAVSKAYNQ